MAIQDIVQQLLPYLLQQPRSRADLLSEAHGLYDPTYDQQYSEAQGDYGLQGSRQVEDYGLTQAGIGRSRSRLLEDTGVSRGRLDRASGNLATDQAQEQGAQKEQLALMGLGSEGGVGDIQRNNLTRSQLIAKQQLQDQYGALDRGSGRGMEDLALAGDDASRQYGRSSYDLGTSQFRGLRGINRSRNSAIEGYATNPAYMFPSY